MADSDNSMTSPHVTRSRLLTGTPNAMAAGQPRTFLGTHSGADPAVTVWREWQAAHEGTERLCHQQQRLERMLVETIGLPCATILLRNGKSVRVHSLEAVPRNARSRPRRRGNSYEG